MFGLNTLQSLLKINRQIGENCFHSSWKIIDILKLFSPLITPSVRKTPPTGNMFMHPCLSIALNVIQCLYIRSILFAVGPLCTCSLFHYVRLQTTVSAINRWVSHCPPGLLLFPYMSSQSSCFYTWHITMCWQISS